MEYRYLSGSPELSAWDLLQRGYGVCRDFAHLAIALNRAFNLPARYVTGHLSDIGFPDPLNHMDFHAYAEVYLGGHWFTTDPRFHVPARDVTGHLPDIGFPDPLNHMDFHAYAEVYLGGHWFTTDPRFH